MRSFSSVALLAVAVAIVAILSIQGAEAHYIRYYYDSTVCGGSQTRLWFLGTSTSCQDTWNSTGTKRNDASFKLTKCNATEGKYTWEGYSGTTTCGGEYTLRFQEATAENCQSLAGLAGSYAGSMRVYCSAGSVAAAAVAVVAAIIALLL